MVDEAIEYAKKGWGVFPCKNKIPLTAHGYKDASKNPDTIRLMFSQFKDCNIAVATGRISGFFVLDIDVKNSACGEESLAELEKEFGTLPDTVESLTWSRGRHIFFKYPQKPIGCKTGLRGGIDIRGDGGYIIVPPSIIEGKPYAWEASHHPDATEIASAPEWLFELIEDSQRFIDLSDQGAKITQNRNSTLMHMAVKMRKMGLEFDDIALMLSSINEKRCIPPLPKKEVLHIAKSISRYSIGGFSEKEQFTDVWSSKIFCEKYGDTVRYCEPLGGWFIWDSSRWKRDDTFQIYRLAKNTVKQMYQMAEVWNNDLLFKHAVKSESEPRLKSMINLLKAEYNIAVSGGDFDNDRFLLNVKNGTLNLETGELLPHQRTDYITKKIELNYNKDAQCPVWLSFLKTIFLEDTELIEFMQKAVGYSLSGSTKEQCIFILFGSGSNGKSTFLKHVFKMLGEYAVSTPASTLMEKYTGSIPNDIARLKGARFVAAVESGKSKLLAESQIKQLTGDDPIAARFLHHEYFDFFATFKIFFATNHMPKIHGTDKGIWRRIIVVPFERVILPHEVDLKLDEKLEAEYEGILAWAVEGFKKWQAEGLGSASKITDLVKEYQEESDIIGSYIQERCVIAEKAKVGASVIVKDMQAWAKENGLPFINRNEFIDYMKRRGFKKEKLTYGDTRGNLYWFGIALKTGGESGDFFGSENENRPF